MTDFVGPSYKLGDVQAACQRTVNMYVQRVGTPEKAQFILRAFPGFSATPFADVAAGSGGCPCGASGVSQAPKLIDFEEVGDLFEGQSVASLYSPSGLGVSGAVSLAGGTLLYTSSIETAKPLTEQQPNCMYGNVLITLAVNPLLTKFNRVSFDLFYSSAGEVRVYGRPTTGGAAVLLVNEAVPPWVGFDPEFSTYGPFTLGAPELTGEADYLLDRVEFRCPPGGQGFAIDNIHLSLIGCVCDTYVP